MHAAPLIQLFAIAGNRWPHKAPQVSLAHANQLPHPKIVKRPLASVPQVSSHTVASYQALSYLKALQENGLNETALDDS